MNETTQADELHGYRHNGEHVGSAYRWPDGTWIVCADGRRFDVADESAARLALGWRGAARVREGE